MKEEQQIKELKLTGTERVVQNNDLIDSPKILNLQEQKLFLFLVSKLDPNNPEDTIFRISINEFAKAIGVNSKNDIYRDVRKAIKHLMGKIVTIHGIEEGCRTTTDIPILGYAKYWHGKGYADIKISSEISPYLFSLHREFTQYKLSQITMLSSIYAIRIYEMLKKQENFGKRTFFIDDLRKKLSITNNKLKAFKDFRLYVLEIAKREINSKTDLKIDFKFIKTGRKITAVEFDIKSKGDNEGKQENLLFFKNEINPSQVREITQFGFSSEEAKFMLDYTDNVSAENAIKAVKNQIKKGNTKNPKGMIRTALKEKWHDNENTKIAIKQGVEKVQKPIKQRTGFMKIFEYLFRK